MLAWAKLLLAGVLAVSPLVECFDTWEQPWSGESKGELVLTVLSCAIVLGYACVRRMSGLLRLLALRWLNVGTLSSTLRPLLVPPRARLRFPLMFGLSPPPLRI
jgi:hypothetical protein